MGLPCRMLASRSGHAPGAFPAFLARRERHPSLPPGRRAGGEGVALGRRCHALVARREQPFSSFRISSARRLQKSPRWPLQPLLVHGQRASPSRSSRPAFLGTSSIRAQAHPHMIGQAEVMVGAIAFSQCLMGQTHIGGAAEPVHPRVRVLHMRSGVSAQEFTTC